MAAEGDRQENGAIHEHLLGGLAGGKLFRAAGVAHLLDQGVIGSVRETAHISAVSCGEQGQNGGGIVALRREGTDGSGKAARGQA